MIEAAIAGAALVCGFLIGLMIRSPQLATARSKVAALEDQLSVCKSELIAAKELHAQADGKLKESLIYSLRRIKMRHMFEALRLLDG